MDIKGSKTEQNLGIAFAGESFATGANQGDARQCK